MWRFTQVTTTIVVAVAIAIASFTAILATRQLKRHGILWTRSEIDAAKRNGDRLVDYVYEHRATHGELPDNVYGIRGAANVQAPQL